ncbi:hypothetical protein ACLMJK_000464 [Lecanora helva]
MPPPTKKRTFAGARQASIAPATQKGIQAFAPVSKPQVQVKGKSILNDINGTAVSNCETIFQSPKRKRQSSPTEEHSIAQLGKRRKANDRRSLHCEGNGSVKSHDDIASVQEVLPTHTNTITPKKRLAAQYESEETPTKGARSLLENVELASPPLSPIFSPSAKRYETPPSSPVSAEEAPQGPDWIDGLPEELQDLVDLHSSFLVALSLHYAHNGLSTPADLQSLASSAGRKWSKRRILIDDIQRVLAVNEEECPDVKKSAGKLLLTDYGHGKICVELKDCPKSQHFQRRPINQEALNATFKQYLQQQWSSYQKSHPDPSPVSFISSLPLLPITPHPSLSKTAPLNQKGQRRLEDLKAGAIKAQNSALNPTTATPQPPTQQKEPPKTATRTLDLFSRLKAKQLHQSTLPSAPSAETLARKSALQRLPEVAPVLESLVLASRKHCNDDADEAGAVRARGGNVAFTMPMVIQHLQMSLRNPIGREEAGGCLKLLAEVVPEWVEVRSLGKLVSVVVRGKGIGRERLRERIEGFVDRL